MSSDSGTSTKTILCVPGMTCNHCLASVTGALTPLAGVTSVVVDLKSKEVTVVHDEARVDRERLSRAIEAVGFEVA